MDGFQTIRWTVDGPVAELVLHRPEALNTYDDAMRDELWAVLTAVRDDPSVQVLLVGGAGRGFSAGADLRTFGGFRSVLDARRVRQWRDPWRLFAVLPAVVVAAVHGFCLGDGLELALWADIRVAARGTVFGLPESRLGFLPGAGGSVTLPRTVGERRALEWLLGGTRLDADAAWAAGLVHRVLPAEGFWERVRAGVRRWLAAAESDPRWVKRAVRGGADLPEAAASALERRLARAAAPRRGTP
ncbi:MAG: enoyl-CoA hydratase/isomerase family protein [Actinomycetia bacterium]|nr:enoyl-CoA hydratase/isomerase family protein [Actinomycetes bacterium]